MPAGAWRRGATGRTCEREQVGGQGPACSQAELSRKLRVRGELCTVWLQDLRASLSLPGTAVTAWTNHCAFLGLSACVQ